MTAGSEVDVSRPLPLADRGSIDDVPRDRRTWRARVRRWMTWRTLLVVLIVLHVAPLWIVTYVPTQDGPAHIYNSHIFFARFDRSNFQIRQFYEFGYQLYPNMLGHLLLGALQQVLPPLIAEKLVVSLIVALVPLSLLYLLNGIERGRGVMCLIGLTFAYNNLFHIGFYNFSLSVSMCLLALGWWWRYKEEMTLVRLGGFYALAALTYVSHFAGYMALVLALTITVGWSTLLRLLLAAVRFRTGEFKIDAKRGLTWAVGMAGILLPLWAIGWDYNYRHYDPTRDGYRTLADLNEVFWETLTLMSYSEWHLRLTPYVLWTTAGVAGLTVLYRLARLQLLQERDALLLTAGALVYLYFTLPWSRNAGGWVNDRLYILAVPILWAWFGRFHKVVNVAVGVALVGIAVAHTGRLAYDYRQLQPDLREVVAATDKVEPHSTVAWELNGGYRPATFPEGTKLVNPWLHALSYYGLKKDVALYSNYEADTPYFLARWGQAPRQDPDYVVAFGTADQPNRVEKFLPRYDVIHESTNLTLLRRKQSPPDMNPWTTLPDGRRALRLNMNGRDTVDGVRRVARDRQFDSGSFGWVRTVPLREWRARPEHAPANFRGMVGDERDRTFRVDLPDGRYDVTLHFAANPAGAYETRVIANDRPVGHVAVPDAAGEPQTIRYTVDVTAGRLLQTFYTTWRASPDRRRLKYWAVNGIEIEQATAAAPATTRALEP